MYLSIHYDIQLLLTEIAQDMAEHSTGVDNTSSESLLYLAAARDSSAVPRYQVLILSLVWNTSLASRTVSSAMSILTQSISPLSTQSIYLKLGSVDLSSMVLAAQKIGLQAMRILVQVLLLQEKVTGQMGSRSAPSILRFIITTNNYQILLYLYQLYPVQFPLSGVGRQTQTQTKVIQTSTNIVIQFNMISKEVRRQFQHLRLIDITVRIGEYKLQLQLPHEIKVDQLLNLVSGHGPLGCKFIGLATENKSQLIDYWLTLKDKSLGSINGPLKLYCLYAANLEGNKITTNHFDYLKLLGKGVAGTVFLVRSKLTGQYFALKQIEKKYISDFKKFEQILRQKKILTELKENKHTIKFHCSFQSVDHLNFVVDYYPGGELFAHLKNGPMRESDARTYFCQIAAGLEYLHKNKILYRDLKPQNILVDVDGHLRIADFGLSKCGFKINQTTKSIVGSIEYMAPDYFQSDGYGFGVDFYSMGAVLYEFLTGLPPFYTNDHEQLQYKIQHQELDLDCIENDDIRQLLWGLLQKDPQRRFKTFAQIKSCAWLKNVNWKNIEQKKSKVLYQLDINKSYILEQFQALEHQADAMNSYGDDTFQPLFEFFNYIKPESRMLILGRPQALQTPVGHSIHSNNSNPVKKSKSKTSKAKQNMSVTIFQKQESENKGNSTNIGEIKTSKHSDNRECYFKQSHSRQKKPQLKIINSYIGVKQQFNIYPHDKNISQSKQKDLKRKSLRLTNQMSCKNLSQTKIIETNQNRKSKSKQKNSLVRKVSTTKLTNKSKLDTKKEVSRRQLHQNPSSYKIRLHA